MKPDNYFYDKINDIYISTEGGIDYIDESEKYITGILKKESDIKGYTVSLQKYIKDWPSRYHLSYVRTNLLEAIKELFTSTWNVLEIGAGIGALTPWLCENFKYVDSIEGSIQRAKALRIRTKKFKNLKVFAGDALKTKFQKKYDLITLIGVLEYVPYYNQKFKSEDVCIEFLRNIHEIISEYGILIIAIENKLGMKYLSGCPEDHNGKFFSNIADYPFLSPVTFSRFELENILKKSGFSNICFYHVFPDYKLPKMLIREDEKFYELGISGFYRGFTESYTLPRLYNFPEALFLKSLLKAKLLFHFSNSFLVLCSKAKETKLETEWIFKKFWNHENTKEIFHHTISIIPNEDRTLVIRRPIQNGISFYSGHELSFNIKEVDIFIRGKSLINEVYKSIIANEYKRLLIILDELRDYILKNFYTFQKDDNKYELVSGKAIDCCYWNFLRTDNGELICFDHKWEYSKLIPLDFVIFRNLFYLYKEIYPFIQKVNRLGFIMQIMKYMFPSFDKDRYYQCLKWEENFQNMINIIPVLLSPNKELENLETYEHKYRYEDYERLLREKEEYIKNIESSRGWRLLKKYYKIRDKIFFKLLN